MSINRSSPSALILKNTGDQGGVGERKQGVEMEEIVPVSCYTTLQWLTACLSVCLIDDPYLMIGISVLNEGEQNLLFSPEYRISSSGRGRLLRDSSQATLEMIWLNILWLL